MSSIVSVGLWVVIWGELQGVVTKQHQLPKIAGNVVVFVYGVIITFINIHDVYNCSPVTNAY